MSTPAASIKGLVEKLADDDVNTQAAAISALAAIGAPALPYLFGALRERDRWFGAARALGRIGAPAIPGLIEALADHRVENFAADALSRVGAPAVEPLVTALLDPERGTSVRAWAAVLLEWAKDRRAVAPLTAALAADDPFLRRSAAHALGEIGDPRAEGPLRRAAGDDDEQVRIAAREALARLDA